MSEVVVKRAQRALREAFVTCKGSDCLGAWGEPYAGYACKVEHNLIDGVTLDACRNDFEAGQGQELLGRFGKPPKMAAIHSSSALVVNTFGPWRADPRGLVMPGHQATTMRFEAQCPTGLDGTAPHLDVRLDGPHTTLGIESKCLEHLTPKRAEFRPAYDTIGGARSHSRWFQQIAHLRANSDQYRYLDVAQLIKHYLGLAHTDTERMIHLLYLYWEPVNWKDFTVFQQHRDEVAQFSESIAGDRVTFEARSYLDVWQEWETHPPLTSFSGHVKALTARYRVAL